MADDDPFYDLFQFFCRHLVSIVYKHEPTRPHDDEGRKVLIASGFVMEIQGRWFLATAGHFMEDLERLRRDRPDRRIVVTIVDSFGVGKIDDTMVPLPYFDLPRHHEHDEEQGIDFGVILLPGNTCDLLAANGRIPVIESHWQDWSGVEFASYTIVGILAEGSKEIGDHGLFLRTAQFDLAPVETPPAQLERFTHPMRFFKITNLGDTQSIVGMSGCPILGIRLQPDPMQMSYFFIGIQSGWIPSKHIIYACDLPFLAKQMIRGLEPDEGDMDQGS
jgi:hypothetical protein